MDNVTYILFDLHGTLIDPVKMHPCYSLAYGQYLSDRYGQSPKQWADANRQIVADWDSYYADLNLDGSDGYYDMLEGMYRTTRAMFRLLRVREPAPEQIKKIALEVPAIAPTFCDAFYDDARDAVINLHEYGYVLGVASHALVAQARATLIGAEMESYFKGPIIGPDTVERFAKDETFFIQGARRKHLNLDNCMVVDDSIQVIRTVRGIGLKGFWIRRNQPNAPLNTFDGLLNQLRKR